MVINHTLIKTKKVIGSVIHRDSHGPFHIPDVVRRVTDVFKSQGYEVRLVTVRCECQRHHPQLKVKTINVR